MPVGCGRGRRSVAGHVGRAWRSQRLLHGRWAAARLGALWIDHRAATARVHRAAVWSFPSGVGSRAAFSDSVGGQGGVHALAEGGGHSDQLADRHHPRQCDHRHRRGVVCAGGGRGQGVVRRRGPVLGADAAGADHHALRVGQTDAGQDVRGARSAQHAHREQHQRGGVCVGYAVSAVRDSGYQSTGQRAQSNGAAGGGGTAETSADSGLGGRERVGDQRGRGSEARHHPQLGGAETGADQSGHRRGRGDSGARPRHR
eukprot:ctg_1665.g340